jgi:hypothetical protein
MKVLFSGKAKAADLAKQQFYDAVGEPAIKTNDCTGPFPMLIDDEIVYCQIAWTKKPEHIAGVEGLPSITTFGDFVFHQVERPE